MKNNRAFISTGLVVTIIILSILLIVIIMRSFGQVNTFSYNVTFRSRQRLANAKHPNCFWGTLPTMRLVGGIATSTITLQCTHVDGMRPLAYRGVDRPELYERILTWITRTNAANNQYAGNALQIDVIRVVAIPNGYRFVFSVEARAVGRYNLTLNENSLRTMENFYNLRLSTADRGNSNINVTN